jgi:hypothetical protein
MAKTEEEKKKANAKYQKKYRKKNLRDSRKRQVEHYEKQKLLVYKYYSVGRLECACCGESEYKFLCIDHINDNGAEDRKKNPSHATGRGLYTRLIKEGYPEGYQLLCFNCNMAKGIHGVCPHKINTTQYGN